MQKKFVIIIAEDVDVISEQTKRSIMNMGINAEIIQTADGEDTLTKILECDPKLVIINNRMPKKTGLEVLRVLNNKGVDLPLVFMITGDWYIETEAKKLGVTKFFKKPYKCEDLADEALKSLF
ncbi:MAG: response regulator [Oscillospiraceae bacterium]|nr:response regulator [Oscillospiraceae bacterium]